MSTIAKTDCNRQPLLFSSLGRRAVQADFSAGRISADASGALLLREADRRIGLIDAMDKVVRDPRNPEMVQHLQRTLLGQRIMGLAQGYEDLNDQQTLRDDPALQLAAGAHKLGKPMASPSTLCRLEQRVTRRDMIRLTGVLVDQFIAAMEAEHGLNGPGELILDFDATDTPLHGNQQAAFFHGYYGGYCYLPLYVFCGDHLLVAYLRPSNIDAPLHARAILKLLVQYLRRRWPAVRITFRGDGGFCRHRLMRWCDANDVGYVIGLARNPVLEEKALPWTVPARVYFERDGEKHRIFGSFSYGAKTWDRQRRVIVKAEHLPDDNSDEGKANTRFVVTNQAGDAQTIYDGIYCQRGEMENRIKEQQLFLFANRMSCQQLGANQFRLLLSAAAYVLMGAVRRLALAGTELANAQADTLRNKLLKTPGRVALSARRLVVELSSHCPYQDLYRAAVARLMGTHKEAPIPSG